MFDIVLDGTVVSMIKGFDHLHVCSVDVTDEDADHVLEIRMQGKTADHTEIDSQGEIIQDILVSISEVQFNDIDLGHVFLEHSVYSHNFNGTQDPVTVPFLGTMGCNGSIEFRFSTPAYLWLLENL
jgi:hypothetical protein